MNFGEILQDVESKSAQYAEQKKQEREDVSIVAGNGIALITSVPQAYITYLDIQASNPRLSPSNIGIVMDAMPDATEVIVKQLETWNKLGRSVKANEKGIKAFVSESYKDDSGRTRRGYKVGRLFDISQTKGKQLPPRPQFSENSPQMNKAFESLIRTAPVKIVRNAEMSRAAYYKPDSQTIAVNESMGDHAIFRELVTEIAFAALHLADREHFSRDDSAIDAESISYMICKRFGVPAEKPDVSRVYELYENSNADERREALDFLKSFADRTGYAIEKNAFPELHQSKQQTKSPRSGDAR